MATQSWRVKGRKKGAVAAGTDGPRLVVRGPAGDKQTGEAMAVDLARFLNGGPRPQWLADMARVSEAKLLGADGSRVKAKGPGKGGVQDPAIADARARLIDRLWFSRAQA